MLWFGLRKRINKLEAEKARPELQKLVDEYYVAGGSRAWVSVEKPEIWVEYALTAVAYSAQEFKKEVLNPQVAEWVRKEGGVKAIKEKLPKPEPLEFNLSGGTTISHLYVPIDWHYSVSAAPKKPTKKRKKK